MTPPPQAYNLSSVGDLSAKQVRMTDGMTQRHLARAKLLHCVRTTCILCTQMAWILTQEYLSPVWLHGEATKPT